MKRSEAVRRLSKSWECNLPVLSTHQADKIISLLESFGMLPPLTDEDRMYNPTLDVEWEDEND